MSEALAQLLSLHAQIERGLDEHLAVVAAQEAEAQRIMSNCYEQRQQLDRKRNGLKEAERIYREAFTPESANAASGRLFGLSRSQALAATSSLLGFNSSDGLPNILSGEGHVPPLDGQVRETLLTSTRPLRARIGPQRFLMFDVMNTMGRVNQEDMAMLAKLPLKRVRDQMVSDVKLGFVAANDDLYSLTSAGIDLLERYKAYKKANGQPLPTADDLSSDEDRDEHEVQDTEAEPVVRPQEPEQAPEPTANRNSVLD